jgi:hypothetical protein
MYNAIVVTMNSNEIDINEWIVHNILLGFEHIYIYDDNSNPQISNIIMELPNNFYTKVTIYRLDSHYEINKGTYETPEDKKKLRFFDQQIYDNHKSNKQKYLMNYFLKYHKGVSKYCFFCDIDEFIYLKDDNSINSYLNKMNNYDIISIPWIYYGTSFYVDKPKGLVIDNFRCHNDKYQCGKSIINMERVDEIHCIHSISQDHNKYKMFIYDRNSPLYSLPIHINHYITKAYKSVLRKKKDHCLGQTNNFNRTIHDILYMGMGGLNIITNEHIMQKYVHNVNNILKYELNNNHIDSSLYSTNGGTILINHVPLTKIGVLDVNLINYIINCQNVEYQKTR